MASEKSPDWLPPGWTVQVKANQFGRKIKCYIDPASGCKFYSKPQVSQYLEKINSCPAALASQTDIGPALQTDIDPTSQTDIGPALQTDIGPASQTDIGPASQTDIGAASRTDIGSVDDAVAETNESPQWLPHGWIVESRTRKSGSQSGKMFKIYIDPGSGRRFYSKPEVSRYLTTVNSGTALQIVTDSVNDHSMDHSTGGDGTPLKPAVSQNGKSSNKSISKHKKPRGGEHSMNNPSMDQSPGDGTSSKTDVSEDCKTHKSSISEQKKISGVEHSMNNVVIENLSADDEFPPGWFKEIRTRKKGNKDLYYTDLKTGYMFRSKPDALRYLETGDVNACKMKPIKRDISDLESMKNDDIHQTKDQLAGGQTSPKPDLSENRKTNESSISKPKKLCGDDDSTNNAVVETVSAEGLPSGWVKEIRTRTIGNRKRKDPYYTDPDSGYMFHSKPDALRYLETGDINTCKIKPKKRDLNDTELMTGDDISPSSAVEGKTLNTTSEKRLFGKERGDPSQSSSLVAPEEVGSSKGRRKKASHPILDVLPILEANQTKKTPQPITRDSTKIETSVKAPAENANISIPGNDILQEEKLLENGPMKHSNGKKTQISIKSKSKRAAVALPARSSKRLAGLKKLEEEKEVPNESGQRQNDQTAPDEQIGKQEAEKQKDEKPEKGFAQETTLNVEPLNKREGGFSRIYDSPVSEETPIVYPSFMDSWSDPCLEFAFKTLTGVLPVEENLSFQDYFQQKPETSNIQKDGGLEESSELVPPGFSPPGYSRNDDVPSEFETPEKSVPENPTTNISPGNVNLNLPSCSTVSPQQQSSLEARNKEFQTKVN